MAIYTRKSTGEIVPLKIPAIKGEQGHSAYEIAVENGFDGDESSWLESLKGKNGTSGVFVGGIDEAPEDVNLVIDNITINEHDDFFADSEYDYLGNAHARLKDVNDANVEHLLRKVNTQKYEGSSIVANNTYAKQVNNVTLKGVTKYKDLDTEELIDNFEEGRNLELVCAKNITLKMFTNNLINPKTALINYSLNTKDGTVKQGSYMNNYFVTDFIEVEPGLTYYKNLRASELVYYDKNKAYVKNIVTDVHGTFTIPEDVKYIRAMGLISNLGVSSQISIGSSKVPYQSFNMNTLKIEGIYSSVSNITDVVNLNTGEVFQYTKTRPYQDGDESNPNVVTDKKITVYKLSEPIVTKIDLQGQKVYSYDGVTYYTCFSEAGYPSPVLSLEVPTDLASLVSTQREEIKSLEAKNEQMELNQNIIIDSQLKWFESVSLLKEDSEMPDYIKNLYELAYERGIRTREVNK